MWNLTVLIVNKVQNMVHLAAVITVGRKVSYVRNQYLSVNSVKCDSAKVSKEITLSVF
jgi:hypothetical protein